MVHLELGHSNTAVLQVAGELAARFKARVIGIATCHPMQMAYGDGYVSGDIIEQQSEEIAKEIKDAEAEFRAGLGTRAVPLGWRSNIITGSLPDYIAREARCADLVITAIASGGFLDSSRAMDAGDLVMQAGRPVLIVPAAPARLPLQRIMVGWKDTREARRALHDALPLLKQAAHVAVVEIAPEEEMAEARTHLAEVVAWLKLHGVAAQPLASAATGDDAAQLSALAREQGADAVVAGAYGHSRLREWALGGVTRKLLLSTERCCLVSH